MQRASRLLVPVLAVAAGSLAAALVMGGDSAPGTTSASSARAGPAGVELVVAPPAGAGATGPAGRPCLGHDGLDSGILAEPGRGASDPGIAARVGRPDVDHAMAIPRCGDPSASDR
jgi:hypothetical protein